MLEPTSRLDKTTTWLRRFLHITKYDSAILESANLVSWKEAKQMKGEYALEVEVPNYTGHGGYSYVHDVKRDIRVAFWGRMLAAFLTGISLIVPMLFMKLYDNLVAQLVTASVCVLVLGIALSFVEEMQKKDVVTATAAYAAVLVVFVGTNS
jgi:hypothetical protein